MNEATAYFGLGAWFGAIRERLRRGEAPFGDAVSEEATEADAESFGAVHKYRVAEWLRTRVESNAPLDAYLSDFHARFRGRPDEKAFWDSVFSFIPTPFPVAIAMDLIDRKIGVSFFGHSWQDESVWWRVVDDVPEAVQNLALNRYIHADFDTSRIDEVLAAFPWWEEIGRILLSYRPDPPEKAGWLAARLREHNLSELVNRRSRIAHPIFMQAWNQGLQA